MHRRRLAAALISSPPRCAPAFRNLEPRVIVVHPGSIMLRRCRCCDGNPRRGGVNCPVAQTDACGSDVARIPAVQYRIPAGTGTIRPP